MNWLLIGIAIGSFSISNCQFLPLPSINRGQTFVDPNHQRIGVSPRFSSDDGRPLSPGGPIQFQESEEKFNNYDLNTRPTGQREPTGIRDGWGGRNPNQKPELTQNQGNFRPGIQSVRNPGSRPDQSYQQSVGLGPQDDQRRKNNEAQVNFNYNDDRRGSNRPINNQPIQSNSPQPDQYDESFLTNPSTGFNVTIPNKESQDPQSYDPVINFAWNLFRNSNSQPNFVLSPLSPQILLTYLAWVAKGTTREEITKVNGYGHPKTLLKLVSNMLKSGSDRELKIATAMFAAEEMRLNDQFLKEATRNVDILNVDFKNPEKASRTITKWVKEKTKDGLKIDKLDFSPATKIAMTSTMYFKGNWIFRFPPAQTDNFYSPEGVIKVPMMSMKQKFKWGKIDDYAEWAAIPYKSQDSLVIILPNQGRSLDETISKLDAEAFGDILNNIDSESKNADVNISLPRFKLESTTNLVQPLGKMGVYELFSPRAQLPYLSDYDAVQVTNAQQQSSLDINEEGTVLVTFTNFNVIALSFQPTIPDVTFKVDRPFLAIVADRENGVPLVIAKVTNPLQKSRLF